MSSLHTCSLIQLIAMHRYEQTLTDTHKCAPHDDREHNCQRRHSFPFSQMYVQLSLLHGLGLVCRFSVYSWHFLSEIMHMCVFIHMHVPMSITVFDSLVASSFLAFRFYSCININFYICCREGMNLRERGNQKGDKSGGKRSASEEQKEDEGMNSHAENTKEWHLDRIKSEIDGKSRKRLWWREKEREGRRSELEHS